MKLSFLRTLVRALSLTAVAALQVIGASTPARALPPGRAWTPVDRYVVPGHTWFVSDWLNTDEDGIPIVMGQAVGGIGQEVHALRWADSLWTVTWAGGFPWSFSWPILSPPGTYYLLWKGIQPYETPTGGIEVDLVMGRFFGDHIGELDTLGRFAAGNWVYSAAVSNQRRWVAISDRDSSGLFQNLRLFLSDAPRSWREVEVGGFGNRGVATAPLDGLSVLVVWAGLGEGLRWGLLRKEAWSVGDLLDGQYSGANVPILRPRPSGGYWLAWGSGADEHLNHLPIRTYRDGQWSAPQAIPCADLPNGFWTSAPDLSRDGGEYPAVVWYATDATGTGRETICACMPTDAGFTVADNIPYAGRPTVARDRNGDMWVAWWDLFDGMHWLHTYNRATVEDVRAEEQGGSRRIAWTLSEPAPETWWAVLRARGQEEFQTIARVRAGPALEMSWTDSAPPAGVLRYRIRRESVDTRYRWDSRIVRTPELIRTFTAQGASPVAAGGELLLQVSNAAAGPLELRLFDVRGRVVLEQQGVASGMGEETVRFGLSRAGHGEPLASGVFFAIVRDASGATSQAVKLVILK